MPATTSAQQILRNAFGPSADGLPASFWELVEQYRGELVNQALAILGSLEDAEDVAQETFCEAFRDREKLVQADSLGAWLRTINRANAVDRLRNRRRNSGRLQNKHRELPPRAFTTGGFSLLELRESLAKAIEALPEGLRAVVVLRYWEQLSYEEIAARLKLPTSTVWRRFYEASEILYGNLRESLEAPGTPHAPAEPGAQDSKGDLRS